MLRKSRKYVSVFILSFVLLALLSTPVSATVLGFVARCDEGIYHQYSYQELLDSYALKVLGASNGLFEDFARSMPRALLDSAAGYVDFESILDNYARAIMTGERFDLRAFLGSNEAKAAQLPATIQLVSIAPGGLLRTAQSLSQENPEPNPPHANTDSGLIIGQPTASLLQAQLWAANRGAEQIFVDIASLYWEFGIATGMRPEVLYAQAAVETDFGRFNGRVPSHFNNWAGIKIATASGDEPGDHEVFPNPADGVRAHFNHMAAYVGLAPLGEPHARFHVVARQNWAGTVRHVEELSGRWTPLPTYHVYILTLLEQIANTEMAIANPAPTPAAEPASQPGDGNTAVVQYVVVNVAILNLRSSPGTDQSILDRLTRGTRLRVNGTHGEWLQVTTDNGRDGWVHGNYVNSVDRTGNPFTGKVIVLDPGHGGTDPGATSITGLLEKELNLAVAHQLAALLTEAGAKVVMTRSDDQSLTNTRRVEIANQAEANLFVSIHANAFRNVESNGTETFYCMTSPHSAASLVLARQLQLELVGTLGLRDRGVKTTSFYILTRTNMPSVLIELGFLTNPHDETVLREALVNGNAARALFRGLEAFLHLRR
ncbi:MAG TPA: N-acetylmuramoyl-L-alanine amidase [Candidatus Limnocylindrales bacterium]|nr:N-acetylmuramoyl-L-alanine amidase [Candidatus Limnocylindrales bacterium]